MRKKILLALILNCLFLSFVMGQETLYEGDGNNLTSFFACNQNDVRFQISTSGLITSTDGCDGVEVNVDHVDNYGNRSDAYYALYMESTTNNNGTDPFYLRIVWNPDFYGAIVVHFYHWRHHRNGSGCHTSEGIWHSSVLYKEAASSPFSFNFIPSYNALTNSIDLKKGTDLQIVHSGSFDGNYTTFNSIKYYLQGVEVASLIAGKLPTTSSTIISKNKFPTTGKYALNSIAHNNCGDHNQTEYTVVVLPTCTDATLTAKLLDKDGTELVLSNGGFSLEKGKQYTVRFSGDPDFANNYTVGTNSPEDIKVVSQTGNEAIIEVLADIGSFRVDARPKLQNEVINGNTRNLYERCPTPSFKVFVGGKDYELNSNCLITIPAYFINANPVIFLLQDTDKGKDAIFSHFEARVTSSVGIRIEVAADEEFRLVDGAELAISAPVVENFKTENTLNWEHVVAYDEEGMPIAEGRSYSDGFGQPLQSQVKNFEGHAVLASQSIYDKYGRPALSSLTAPVRGNTTQTSAVSSCGSDVLTGEDLYFEYKGNFVANIDGSAYTESNFDKTTPDPISTTHVGTLGYFYSINNITNPETNLRESRTPISSSPYTRVRYNKWSEIEEVSAPGDYTTLGSGHTSVFTKQAISKATDPYLTKYFILRGTLFDQGTVEDVFIEALTIDPQGQRTRTVSNAEGQTLIAEHLATHDQTWYFYNDRGQVIVVLPPVGVNDYLSGVAYATIQKKTFNYDFRGLMLQSTDPDRGTTKYLYRKDGAMRFSQDARQKAEGKFSYVNYDFNDRSIETGEFKPADVTWASNFGYANTALVALLERDATNEYLGTGGIKNDVTTIGYDEVASDVPFVAEFVMGKMAWTEKPNVGKTHYTYDERARLVQSSKDLTAIGLGQKSTRYYYGSASGQVSVVAYQEGQTDAFFHYYKYDAHGRLGQAYTSRTAIHNSKGGWNAANVDLQQHPDFFKQVDYNYYLTGGLKRTELADKLQGLDYTYTIQGQLKAINSPYYKSGTQYDPGQDGSNGFSKDIFGMALDYYTGDFSPVDITLANNYASATSTGTDRFDGLIKNASVANFHLANTLNVDQYSYDNKNQLALANGKTGTYANNAWTLADKGISETSTYDAQGNFISKGRVATLSSQNATLSYDYIANTNKLSTVKQGNTTMYAFTYDAAGRMIQRTKGTSTQNFTYDASDMVTQVKDGSSKLRGEYIYDEFGQKVAKKFYDNTETWQKTEYYSYDPNGILMAIYKKEGQTLKLTEVPIYGMERLGVMYITQNGQNQDIFSYTYEIKDQIGSVRATILRTKKTDGTADVLSYGEYFAFGAEVNDRSTIGAFGKRFGFQGEWAEKDRDENNDWTEFDLRHYDADLGRWMVPDSYNQFHSPYLAMGNNPINIIDPNGGWGVPGGAVLRNISGFRGGLLKLLGLGEWTGNAMKNFKLFGNAVNTFTTISTATSTINSTSRAIINVEQQTSPQDNFPDFQTLWDNYPEKEVQGFTIVDKHPCQDKKDNGQLKYNSQCAISMDITLEKSGVDLSEFKKSLQAEKTEHPPLCSHGHIKTAENMAKFLLKKLKEPPIKMSKSEFNAKYDGVSLQGIVYFEWHYGEATGHIDLYRGTGETKNGNYAIHPTPGNSEVTIWFWPIK